MIAATIVATATIRPDEIALWAFIPTFILTVAAWLIVEVRSAQSIPPDHPEAVTGLDVLERTGSHPG